MIAITTSSSINVNPADFERWQRISASSSERKMVDRVRRSDAPTVNSRGCWLAKRASWRECSGPKPEFWPPSGLSLLTLSLNCSKLAARSTAFKPHQLEIGLGLEITNWEAVCTMESGPAPDDHRPPQPESRTSSDDAVPQRTLNSADLFQGAREVHIRHDEKIYRLQVTRNGKLILIK
jgi:hemin uptake protein HemP